MILFYTLYNILLTLALPFIWLASYFNDKLGQSFSGQKKIWKSLEQFRKRVEANPKPVVWLHAASAGEFEQIIPLLTRLKDKDVHVFQTLTSSTIYFKVSQSELFDGVSFLPWDLYPRVDRFIKTLQPTIFINTRHDVWPNLMLALSRSGVRNVLINANLYESSLRLKPGLKEVNKKLFGLIDHIYTGSNELRELLEQIYDGPLEVTGDTRFDRVSERAANNTGSLIANNVMTDRRVIVYGSVIDSDLDTVSKGIAGCVDIDKKLHIIVPHEVRERDLIPWEVEMYRHKIKSIRLSEIEDYAGEPVIIWNSIGQLADLYKHAHLAYIGAGFSTGVHSVTEAAVYAVPAAHGPVFDILAEAIELVNIKLSTVVNTPEDLTAFLQMEEATLQRNSAQISSFIKQRVGASDIIVSNEVKL